MPRGANHIAGKAATTGLTVSRSARQAVRASQIGGGVALIAAGTSKRAGHGRHDGGGGRFVVLDLGDADNRHVDARCGAGELGLHIGNHFRRECGAQGIEHGEHVNDFLTDGSGDWS